MKSVLKVIGAVVVTTVILGVPILSFVSFLYDWNGFIIMSLLLGSAVDFLCVLNKLIEETE
jgi:hypothetical protein